jgi:hypothetical protein
VPTTLSASPARFAAEAVASALGRPLVIRNVTWAVTEAASTMPQFLADDRRAAWEREHREQAELLREIVGNPFRPATVPEAWPADVLRLAQAQNTGADCAFALHDALCEAGLPELAQHFHETRHPKGCWVVDLILGKG